MCPWLSLVDLDVDLDVDINTHMQDGASPSQQPPRPRIPQSTSINCSPIPGQLRVSRGPLISPCQSPGSPSLSHLLAAADWPLSGCRPDVVRPTPSAPVQQPHNNKATCRCMARPHDSLDVAALQLGPLDHVLHSFLQVPLPKCRSSCCSIT